MTVLDVGECACGKPATRTLGARAYCTTCAETILAPLKAKHPSNTSVGVQAGPIRPDWGLNHCELECLTCRATWVGRINEPCPYCLKALDEPRREKLRLAPPPDTNDAYEATQGPISDDPDDTLRAMLVDWPAFWAHDHQDAEWLAEPLLPAGRSVALFAPGGTGKSLLALWLAANIATGTDPFTGRAQEPVDVLYLDYEMTESDLSERLEQMGYSDANNLSQLHYALLPSLPGLDQPEGGRAVVRLAELCNARLVIVDTFGRAVHGDENDADTVRAWYRWTGLHLKHDGRAFLRVDHAGKDLAKGQRGSSAKNDDVDVVWQMTAKDQNTFTLTAKKRRMGWVPLKVEITQTDPLGYQLVQDDTYPVGTVDIAQALDALQVPDDAGVRTCARVLRDNGHKARQEVIRAAVKYRKARCDTLYLVGDNPVDGLHQAVHEVEKLTREQGGWNTPKRSPGRDDRVTRPSGNTLPKNPSVTSPVTPTNQPPDQAVTPPVTPVTPPRVQTGNTVSPLGGHSYPAPPTDDLFS